MADPPITMVITRRNGGVAWMICSGRICVAASTIRKARFLLNAICRSRGIEPPRWPRG
jgi:hypothetical protein